MNKRQTPQPELAAFFGKLSSARYWIMIALIALCLMTFKATAFGQVGCIEDCQQALSGCLQTTGGDPLSEVQCQDKYDTCAEGCLIH